MINTMKILVTGATGRIGRHLVAALLEEGETVRILAREPEKAKELWGTAVEIVTGDVMNNAAVVDAVKGADIVYHLAAMISYDVSREALFAVNVEGTKNVLEAARGKRIICLSSTSVYGKHTMGKNGGHTITEEDAFAPTDLYGESKAEADTMARAAGAVVIRPAFVYGPGFSEGVTKLFELISKKKMVVAGEGTNRIQWTHVDDLVSALLLARRNGRGGEAYVVVSDDVKTQLEMLELIARLLEAPVPRIHVPIFALKTVGSLIAKKAYIGTFASDRYFDCSKAKKDLNWQPKVVFEEGMKDLVDEYFLGRKFAQKK